MSKPLSHLLFVMIAAAATARAQSVPAIHPLGPVMATSPATFSIISNVVALSDGSVLLADERQQRLTLLDASLANPRVVLDSVRGRANTFASGIGGGAPGTMGSGAGGAGGGSFGGPMAMNRLWQYNFVIPFRADSSLWYDAASTSFVVVYPDGSLGRAIAAPPFSLVGSGSNIGVRGLPLLSPTLGLVYRAKLGEMRQVVIPAAPTVDDTTTTFVFVEDTMSVMVMNLATRAIDTIARLGIGTHTTNRIQRGRVVGTSGTTSLYSFYDDVVVTADGTIGLFHAREYRFDWIEPNGARRQGARLPYSWRQVTDDLREQLIDSINRTFQRTFDSLLAVRAADSARTGSLPTVSSSYTINGVITTRQIPKPPPPPPRKARPEEIPDYLPSVRPGAPLADADGNVWLRPVVVPLDRENVVYDIVSPTAGIVDRVRIPVNRLIVGFGKGGIVYLAAHDAGVVRLEKVRVK